MQPSEPSSVLCDDLEGYDGEGMGEGSRGRDTISIELIHSITWRKPTQHPQAITLWSKREKRDMGITLSTGLLPFPPPPGQ